MRAVASQNSNKIDRNLVIELTNVVYVVNNISIHVGGRCRHNVLHLFTVQPLRIDLVMQWRICKFYTTYFYYIATLFCTGL